jgi:hypothetical protein
MKKAPLNYIRVRFFQISDKKKILKVVRKKRQRMATDFSLVTCILCMLLSIIAHPAKIACKAVGEVVLTLTKAKQNCR